MMQQGAEILALTESQGQRDLCIWIEGSHFQLASQKPVALSYDSALVVLSSPLAMTL